MTVNKSRSFWSTDISAIDLSDSEIFRSDTEIPQCFRFIANGFNTLGFILVV